MLLQRCVSVIDEVERRKEKLSENLSIKRASESEPENF
jgi:hypothetical protein